MNSAAATTDVGLSEPSHKSSGKSNQKQPVDLEVCKEILEVSF